VAAVVWTLLVFVVCALANALALRLFAGLLVVLASLWFGNVRRRFRGPAVDLPHFEERS
jgi:hypothetical protein